MVDTSAVKKRPKFKILPLVVVLVLSGAALQVAETPMPGTFSLRQQVFAGAYVFAWACNEFAQLALEKGKPSWLVHGLMVLFWVGTAVAAWAFWPVLKDLLLALWGVFN